MMESTNCSVDCHPRFATNRDLTADTYGGRVAEISEALGTPLMPWQRLVADVALEIDPATGRLKYREVILTVPRQSGKTTLILSVSVHRALGFGGRQNIVYSAQTRKDAVEKMFDDQWPALADSAFRSLVRPRKTTGHEAWIWSNGSKQGLVANTEKSGHGSTLDLAFVDEAFAQTDDRLEQAFSPAMITRPEPQQWTVSTAGTDASVYLARKVAQGRTNVNKPGSSTAFFEWSADPESDPADPATWWACMPGLGHTVTEAAVKAEFEKMELAEFKRAYLNIPTRADEGESVISPELWLAGRFDDGGGRQMPDPVVFALDGSEDLESVAIAAAGDLGFDRAQVEIVEHRAGSSWAVGRLVELCERWNGRVVVAPKSPAALLIPDLRRAGIDPMVLTAGDVPVACGVFRDLAVNGRLSHGAHPGLDLALPAARRRAVADQWVWVRKDARSDISPLYAATLAVWAAMTLPAPVVDVSMSVW